VFKALDKKANEYVAIKKALLMVNDSMLQSESETLKACDSKFIVHYKGVMKREREIGVVNVCCG